MEAAEMHQVDFTRIQRLVNIGNFGARVSRPANALQHVLGGRAGPILRQPARAFWNQE